MSNEHTPLLQAVDQQPRLTQRLTLAVGGGILAIVALCVVLFSGDSGENFTIAAVKDHFLSGISNESLAEFTKQYYLSNAHLAGQNEALVQWTKSKLEDYGWETRVDTYDIYLNRPLDHSVALINGSKILYQLSLEEDVLENDETTKREDRIPTFHGYSAPGNATGQLVYANYGRKRDYEQLVAHGIDLTGKVVIVRYGGLFRGLKVKFAEQLGASAVLIYSDPADDDGITEKNGYKAYPDGPARQPSSVQRGSVQDLTLHPGDPTTPGWASVPGARREDPEGLVGIPSIPISYRDALPLLKALNGHGPILGEWQGDLTDVDYALGPSELEVNVWNDQDYDLFPIRNVMARLQGEVDEEVVIGNHRDAWILGGADPNSGSVVLLELARVLGGLYKQGWKPYRTLVLASWDGEEYGLLGSTEYGEDYTEHIDKQVLAYLNCDMAYSGTSFGSEASPLLSQALYAAAREVTDPFNSSQTLFDAWSAQPHGGKTRYLGSGSDYTVFQDHIGVPSLDMSYSAQAGDAVYHYHSNYDSYYWMTHYGDTTFHAHRAITQVLGLLAIDLAQKPLVQFTVSDYATGIEEILSSLLSSTEVVDDQTDTLLRNARELVSAAELFDNNLYQLREDLAKDYPWYKFVQKYLLRRRVSAANLKLFYLEREFVHEDGLDDRQWYKHVFFAPGRYTGYAGQVAPGIAEALEDRDWNKLSKWIGIINNAINRVTNIIQ